MAKNLLVINVDFRETRVALIENGIIAELHIERHGSRGTLGNIYLGKVSRVLPGMQAAFIEIGLERAAFLHVEDLIRPDDFDTYLSRHAAGGRAAEEDDSAAIEAVESSAGAATEAVVTEDRSSETGVVETPIDAGWRPEPHGAAHQARAEARAAMAASPVLHGDAAGAADSGEATSEGEAPGTSGSSNRLDEPAPPAEVSATPMPDGPGFGSDGGPDVASLLPQLAAEDDDDEPIALGLKADDYPADSEDALEGLDDAELPDDDHDDVDDDGFARRASSDDEGEPDSDDTEEIEHDLDRDFADADAEDEGLSFDDDMNLAGPGGADVDEDFEGSTGAPFDSRRGELPLDHGQADAEVLPLAAAGLQTERAGAAVTPTESGAHAEPGQRPGLADARSGQGQGREGQWRGEQGQDRGGRSRGKRVARAGRDVRVRRSVQVGRAAGAPPQEPGPAVARQDPRRSDPRRSDQGGGGRGPGQGGSSGRGDRGREGGHRGRGEGQRDSRSGDGNRPQGQGSGGSSNRSNGGRGRNEPSRISKNTPITEVVREGQEVIVQVSKEPIGTKGARVTSHISLPGRYVVYMPTVEHVGISKRIGSEKERSRLRQVIDSVKPPTGGLIVRTLAEGLTKKQLKADVGYLVRLWGEVAKKREVGLRAPTVLSTELDIVLKTARDMFGDDIEKIVIDDRDAYLRLKRFIEMFMPERVGDIEFYDGEEPIFDAYGIEDEIGRALSRKVPLPSGGYLIIDQAEALTAIDVNTGRFVGKGSKDLEDTILKTNLEAVEEIAYQLRFRNIGGLIILDLIDMERASNREKVRRTLEALLQKDKAKTTLNRISDLGLIEMTRKRTRESLGRVMHEACFYCDGTGQLQSKQTVAYEILRQIRRDRQSLRGYSVVVNAHPAVVDLLKNDERAAVQEAEKRFMRRIELVARKEYHLEQFDLQGK